MRLGHIELYCVVGTGVLNGASAIDTILGRNLGSILLSEIGKCAVGLNLLTLLAQEPLKNINVVAGFLKQHIRAALRVAPVTSYEAVGLVYIPTPSSWFIDIALPVAPESSCSLIALNIPV